MKTNRKSKIVSFKDLEVYKDTYESMLIIFEKVLPRLPEIEKFDLKDQLRRSSKAIPRLIAEGFAKKHQKAGFQKYLDDALAECNETIVGLQQSYDLYKVNKAIVDNLLLRYDKSSRQIYRLAQAWTKFKQRKTTT